MAYREASAYSLFMSPWRQSFLSQYDRFYWEYGLEKEYREASAHSLFRSPGKHSALSQYNRLLRRCSWKGHTGKPLHICSGLLGRQSLLSGYNKFYWDDGLAKGLQGSLCTFFVHISWKTEFVSQYNMLTQNMVLWREYREASVHSFISTRG